MKQKLLFRVVNSLLNTKNCNNLILNLWQSGKWHDKYKSNENSEIIIISLKKKGEQTLRTRV